MKLNKFFAALSIIVLVFLMFGSFGASLRNTLATTAEPTTANPLLDDDRKWIIVHELPVKDDMYKQFVIGNIAFDDPNLGIFVGAYSSLYVTKDGGKTWTQAKANFMTSLGVDIVSPSIMWMSDCTAGVRFTKDGGQTWDAEEGSTKIGTMISFIDDKMGWLADSKELAVTTDGSKSWTEVSLPQGVPNLLQAIDLRTANDGYLFTLRGDLFTTTDGGKMWTSQSTPVGMDKHVDLNVLPMLRFVDADHGMLVLKIKDGDFTSFKTNDGGKTWAEYPIPVKGDVASIYLSHDGNTLTVTVYENGRQSPAKGSYVLSFEKP